MNCMKCGREIPSEQVFCPECLAEMEKYPVKPGTVVQLPKRSAASSPKKPARKVLSPEEQVKLLKRNIRGLWAALAAVIILLALAICVAIYGLQDEEFQFLPGQNYSVVDSSTSTESD